MLPAHVDLRIIGETIGLSDYFFPSLEDGQALSKKRDPEAMLDWCFAHKASAVLLKLGDDGVQNGYEDGSPMATMSAIAELLSHISHLPELPTARVSAACEFHARATVSTRNPSKPERSAMRQMPAAAGCAGAVDDAHPSNVSAR